MKGLNIFFRIHPISSSILPKAGFSSTTLGVEEKVSPNQPHVQSFNAILTNCYFYSCLLSSSRIFVNVWAVLHHIGSYPAAVIFPRRSSLSSTGM